MSALEAVRHRRMGVLDTRYHGKTFPRTLMHAAASRWLDQHKAQIVGWAKGRAVFWIEGGLYWPAETYTKTTLMAIRPQEVDEWRKTKLAKSIPGWEDPEIRRRQLQTLLAKGFRPNPMGSSLYESFHGNPPARLRRIRVNWPKKGERLIAIGRLSAVEYTPEWPSRKAGTRYTHALGDTGRRILKHKPILATRESGKGLFIIPDRAKSTRLTERGIVG